MGWGVRVEGDSATRDDQRVDALRAKGPRTVLGRGRSRKKRETSTTGKDRSREGSYPLGRTVVTLRT